MSSLSTLKTLLVSLLLLHLAGTAFGAVWRVEKDGSGDFTIIQDAVDAAQDGDVIQVGPGRFDDFFVDPQWGNFRVWLDGDKSLTFVGAGNGTTIIGPEEYGNSNQDWGIYCASGPVTIRILGVRFENLDRMGVALTCDIVEIDQCEFFNCNETCLLLNNQSGSISNSQFYDCIRNSTILAKLPNLVVSGCYFEGCHEPVYCDSPNSDGFIIQNCQIEGRGTARSGIFFYSCGGQVINCSFRDVISFGVYCDQSSDVVVQSCIFENIVGINGFVGKAFQLEGGQSFEAFDNIISGCELGFQLTNPFMTSFSAHDNHFFPSEDSNYFIETNDDWAYWEYHWDFGGNYWGTTDVDEVSQWIFDGNDSSATTMYVDFLPLADSPVSTEATTLDAIKVLYR